MTTPASNIPISVDYTSRDYYSLREALIKRVSDRTGGKWTGNDPSDFGVALVESFAYMGDLINYYIDRVANESYLGTATQRQNVLNLASMIGYTAGGYTSAVVNVTLTTTGGYQGNIGASQLTGGTARLAIPNDNTFAVGDTVNVSGLSRSEYNGTFTITNKTSVNELEYVPASYTVTASGDGTLLVYTTSVQHNLLVGEKVTISGFTGGSSSYNLANQTITQVTNNTFTVGSSLNGSTTGSGTVVYADIATSSDVGGYVHSTGFANVPAGTQIAAEVTSNNTAVQLVFTTLSTASIPFVNDDGTSGSTTVLARHGIDVATLSGNQASSIITPDINGELIGYSSGQPDQAFALLETEVDTSTIKIYVENGNAFDTWSAVQHLEDSLPTDKVFKVVIDGDYNVYIQFGDGIGGAIPTATSRIKASYFVGAGLIGNIPAGSLTSIYDVPGATSLTKTLIMSKVTPTNLSAASGGEVPESLDSIRHNAPRALRALTRAVTLEDFANLAISIPQVGKANAVASLPTSVSVYIAPERSLANPEITPGVDPSSGAATSALVSLKGIVSSYLSDKVQIGTTVTVLEPRYAFVYLNIQYSKINGYSQADVEAAIKAVIDSKYSYENLDFQTTITPQMIETDLRAVDGVANVYVHDLARRSGGGRNTLSGALDEIFVVSTSSTFLTLTPASTTSTLSALQLVSGSTLTLSPAFNPNVLTYAAGTSGTSVDVTATGSAGQSISIADQSTGSGASRTVALSIGPNVIPITVTAADGVTTTTYVVTVTKS